MSRACDLGPGDVWGSPSDDVDHCTECGVAEDFDVEFCSAGRCAACCAEHEECHVECSVCHALTDEYERFLCVNCLVADEERKNAQRERWAAMLEDKGDEMREERL